MELFKYRKKDNLFEVYFTLNEQFAVLVIEETQAITLVDVMTKALLAGIVYSSNHLNMTADKIFNIIYKKENEVVTENPDRVSPSENPDRGMADAPAENEI